MVSATEARVILVRTVAEDVEYLSGKNWAIVLPSLASFAFVGLYKRCEGGRVCMSGCLLRRYEKLTLYLKYDNDISTFVSCMTPFTFEQFTNNN